MSDLSASLNLKSPPEGGAFGPLYNVLARSRAMHQLAKQEEPVPTTAQVIEAESEAFQDDMRHVGRVMNIFMSRLATIEINVWNLRVREALGDLGRNLVGDLNEAYRISYPATFSAVAESVPNASLPIPGLAPATVENVLLDFQERFIAIYEAWREANPCLRRHKVEHWESLPEQRGRLNSNAAQ